MDVDWCLSCGRHINPDTAYCSQLCRSIDGPSASHGPCVLDESTSESLSESCDDDDLLFHPIRVSPPPTPSRWPGNSPEGIAAWAKDIPFGPPDPLPTPDAALPHSPPHKAFRPPKLLLPYRRPLPPTLCMSTPYPTRPQPSVPITTPQQHIASLSITRSTSDGFGSTTTSGTESLATPSSSTVPHPLASHHGLPPKACFPGTIATLCSWVSPRSHQHTISPAPTHKPLASRRPDPTPFTVLAKAHPSSALRLSSRPDETDGSSSEDDGIWWLSSPSGFQDEKSSSKLEDGIQPRRERGQRPATGMCADHPAYRSRGRLLSRKMA